MIYRSQVELEEAVRYWRAVLGLRDWTVKATISRHYEMSDAGRQGECEIDEAHRFVRIWLQSEEDYEPSAVFEQDHESTLVHELLHVHYVAVQPEEDEAREWISVEQSINAIMGGLIKLKRGQV